VERYQIFERFGCLHQQSIRLGWKYFLTFTPFWNVGTYLQKYNSLAYQQVSNLQEDVQFEAVTFAPLSYRFFSKQSQYVHGLTHLIDGLVQGFHRKTKEPPIQLQTFSFTDNGNEKVKQFCQFYCSGFFSKFTNP
jgi:hypothetical protein